MRCSSLLSLLVLAGPLAAAQIETMTGRVLEGELVEETAEHLRIRMGDRDAQMTMELPKQRVHRLRANPDDEWRVLTAKEAPVAPRPDPREERRAREAATAAAKEQAAAAAAAEAPRLCAWRGDHSGRFPDATPPLDWSARRWTASLSGRSNASPVFDRERVFCCEEPDSLVCVDKASGAVLWKAGNSIAEAGGSGEPHSTKWVGTYGWTTPTPVVYGPLVWASFGNGVVACYDLQGQRRWITKVHVGGHSYMTAASGCLIGDLFVCYMAREDWVGTVYAFEALTGTPRWQTEVRICQGSLIPLELDGRRYVLSSGGDLLDAASGTKLQSRWFGKDGRNWGPTAVWDLEARTVIFPVYDGTQEGDKPMVCLRLDPNGPPQELWRYASDPQHGYGGRMYDSPVLVDGIFYAIRLDGLLFALDASSGEELFQQQLGKHGYASLAWTGGDGGRIWIMGGKEMTVIRPGRSYQELARFDHGCRDFLASPVFDGGAVYLRDGSGLHCIGLP